MHGLDARACTWQGCTALQELYLGELDGVSYHPSSTAIPAVRMSQLEAFRRRMPLLRTLSLSAEVRLCMPILV